MTPPGPGLLIIRLEDTCFRKGSSGTHQRMAASLQSLVLLRLPGKRCMYIRLGMKSNLPTAGVLDKCISTPVDILMYSDVYLEFLWDTWACIWCESKYVLWFWYYANALEMNKLAARISHDQTLSLLCVARYLNNERDPTSLPLTVLNEEHCFRIQQ